MTPLECFILIAIIALLELDTVAVLQVMVSRPLVSATLCGTVLGEPVLAAAAGAVLEMMWLGRLPVGSVVPPDLCLAGAVGGIGAAVFSQVLPGHPDAAAAAGVLAAMPTAWLGGKVEIRLRRTTTEVARRIEREVLEGDESALGRGLRQALGLRLAASSGMAALAVLLWVPGLAALAPYLGPTALNGLDWFYWLALLLGLVVLLDYFWERQNLKLGLFSLLVFALMIYALEIRPVAVIPMAVLAGIWLFLSRRGSAAPKEEAA